MSTHTQSKVNLMRELIEAKVSKIKDLELKRMRPRHLGKDIKETPTTDFHLEVTQIKEISIQLEDLLRRVYTPKLHTVTNKKSSGVHK
jgi:hypothetical protein